ncbi:hypothetical protein PanWU01x14_073710, partial [Parasponia andersonii]
VELIQQMNFRSQISILNSVYKRFTERFKSYLGSCGGPHLFYLSLSELCHSLLIQWDLEILGPLSSSSSSTVTTESYSAATFKKKKPRGRQLYSKAQCLLGGST